MFKTVLRPTINLPEDIPRMQLSPALKKHLNLTSTCTIMIGENQVSAVIEDETIRDHTIALNAIGFQLLLLPLRDYTFLVKKNEAALLLGPVLTIVTDAPFRHDQFNNHMDIFLKEITRYTEKHGGICTILSLSNGKTETMLVNKEWQEGIYPQPDIVYNRIHSHSLEKSDIFLCLLKYWEEHQVTVFNQRYLSKLEVHETLSFLKPLTLYLPDTVKYTKETLSEWLTKYDDVYLKPIFGSQGKDIFHIYKKQQTFYIAFSNAPSIDSNHSNDLTAVCNAIDKYLKNQQYLIQETIVFKTLPTNHSLDFRILCMKTNETKWDITSMVARVSAPHQFVTNIAQGGSILRANEALHMLFPEKNTALTLELIKDFAKSVCETLALHTSGHFAEFGLDIGIDMDGKPWLIEVNTKPSKELSTTTTSVRPSTKKLYQYALFCWQKKGEMTID